MPYEMNAEKISSIKEYQKSKPTEELVSIWIENDTDDWDAEAFVAIKEILIERGVDIPSQKSKEELKYAKYYDWSASELRMQWRWCSVSGILSIFLGVGNVVLVDMVETKYINIPSFMTVLLGIVVFFLYVISAFSLSKCLNILGYSQVDRVLAVSIMFVCLPAIGTLIGLAIYQRRIRAALREKEDSEKAIN